MRVRDLDGAIHFYRDVLGMELTERHEMPNGTVLAFLRMGATGTVELVYRPDFRPAEPVPSDRAGLQHVALRVTNLDDWVSYLGEQDVKLTVQPFSIQFPSGVARGLFFTDPEGNPIELMERAGR